MKINPDLFSMVFRGDDKVGMKYPDCPINSICAFISTEAFLGDDLDTMKPTKENMCKFFKEPEQGERDPECMYVA